MSGKPDKLLVLLLLLLGLGPDGLESVSENLVAKTQCLDFLLDRSGTALGRDGDLKTFHSMRLDDAGSRQLVCKIGVRGLSIVIDHPIMDCSRYEDSVDNFCPREWKTSN
jgi:hypothetical protein